MKQVACPICGLLWRNNEEAEVCLRRCMILKELDEELDNSSGP